jgi:hypothetical protein
VVCLLKNNGFFKFELLLLTHLTLKLIKIIFFFAESTSSSNVDDGQFNFVSRTSSAVAAASAASSSSSTGISSKSSALYQKDLENGGSSVEHAKEEFLQNSLDSRPYFDDAVSQNVTVLVGGNAYLKCRVHNLGNKTVGR